MGGCAWILCRSPIVAHHGSPATQQCTQTPPFGVERPDPLICVHYYGHTRLPATQQCTQTPKTGARRLLPPICVHYCGHGAARDTIVYTNAPIRRGEPRSSHLCTLLRPRGHPQLNSVHKCIQGTAEEPSRVRYVVSPQLPLEECRDLVERDGVLPAPVVEVGVHRARNDHQLLVLGVVASPRHVGKRVLAEVP